MKDLVKWQVISFVSRGIAMALGIVQSFVIVRILSVSEWGVVQIATSIGGAFGIYQHLGLSSGLTREISAAKKDTDIFKMFLTGTVIRYCVTIPIALFLFFLASHLAISKYSDPSLILPIKIYALVLLFQGVRSMFDAVLSGTKRFKQLFIFQSAIALVSVLLYVPLVYLYKVNGYFFALVTFSFISSVVLGVLAFKPLKGSLEFPTRKDFKVLLKDLLSISLAIYAVKVIYTWWEKSGPLLLGLDVSKELVGFFAFALLYGKKLMMVSDSVTAVNLPVLSEEYTKNFGHFKELFSQNFDKVFAFIVFVAVSAIFWSKDLIQFVVGGDKYDRSLSLILPMVFAFIFYSLTNIIKSSIIIPAKMIKTMLGSFVILLGTTVGFYFVTRNFMGGLDSMAYAMVFGGLLSFVVLTTVLQIILKFRFFTFDHVLILLQGLVIALSEPVDGFLIRLGIFVVFVGLYLWAVFVAGFLKKEDVRYVVAKVRGLNRAG
jgi:O-antigen/teichoic acid export membrane protein